ncbi:Transcription factor [Niveomyces insectorum RCEF 264]|uniref:Transcription factor n=1 Tax=Niveomyces insectorum RCEF 264 TaxID=1081102 RepID=A0A168A542_9HYPO|nr:Transcription factor [Niveomyces insectorum RCEF 264]
MDISDLLVRHEKLVHLNEGSKDGNRGRKPSSGSGHTNSSEDHGNAEAMDLRRRTSTSHYPGQQASGLSMSSAAAHPATALSAAPPPPQSDPRLAARNIPACNLDLLSDAATHLASAAEINAMQQPMMSDMAHTSAGSMAPGKPYSDAPPPYHDRGRDGGALPEVLSSAYPGQPPPASFDDYHLFLDDFTSSSHFLPSALEADQPFGLWSRPAAEMGRGANGLHKMAGSSFPSTRFPSVQPDLRDMNPEAGSQRVPDEGSNTMRAPAWRIGVADHTVIKNRLDEFSSVLPSDFVCPSRHTLTRFLEGYISGFHEHLPFLHLPTLSPADLSPELILAILAVGAQYRFENHRGNALWYAAKAIAFEQIRRRHSHEVHSLLPTSSAYSPHSTRPSPSAGYRHSFNSMQHERPLTQDTHREPYSPNTPQSRLETIQALTLLFAIGLWGPKAILHEALSLQSLLALLVRDEGLESEPSSQAPDWDTWIRIEGSTRTKLIAFCFFNLCSIVYNTPPLLLTSEVNLCLPQPSRLWRMETAWQWQEARQSYPPVDMSLQDAFSRILHRDTPQTTLTHVPSLGSYVLIHAFIQHIYLLKQTSFAIASPYGVQRGLKVEDVEEVAHGLRLWQIGFEHHRQLRAAESAHHQANGATMGGLGGVGMGMGQGDSYSGGPVAFDATALLRLAYIRLYTDLNPSRRLETRDHLLIANAFDDVPLLVRSPRTTRAVVQAIHALAMLVKAGVNYVARTKSLEWSMQLSLCNMECALLLSKWLITLASIGPNDAAVSSEEKTLLDNVRRLLDETEFAVPIDPSLAGAASGTAAPSGNNQTAAASDAAKLRQLAAAVIHLWAETFKGTHVFEVISIMGLGLESYAAILEKPGDRTPLAQMPPAGSLG